MCEHEGKIKRERISFYCVVWAIGDEEKEKEEEKEVEDDRRGHVGADEVRRMVEKRC